MEKIFESLCIKPLTMKAGKKMINISGDEKKKELIIWAISEHGEKTIVSISTQKNSLRIITDCSSPLCSVELVNVKPGITQSNDTSGLAKINIDIV